MYINKKLLTIIGLVVAGTLAWFLIPDKSTAPASNMSESNEQKNAENATDEAKANVDNPAIETPVKSTDAASAGQGTGKEGVLDESVDHFLIGVIQKCGENVTGSPVAGAPDANKYQIVEGDFDGNNVKDLAVNYISDGTGKYGRVCVYTTVNKGLKLQWLMPEGYVLAQGKISSYSATAFKYYGKSADSAPLAPPDITQIFESDGGGFALVK
jgi:hypothetical protein